LSDYIMDLRKLVGHRTLIQCAGSVIIVDGEGRLLLGRRTDNHLWGYAGGSVEIDERVEDCARRELFEETGLTAGELEFFMVSSGPEIHYVYPNGDEVSNIEIIYICRDWQGELRPQEKEVEELRFFEPSEIDLQMISPPIRCVVERYLMRFGVNRTPRWQKALDMSFQAVYSALIAKAEKKGRTRAEVDEVTSRLTGYTADSIATFKGSYGVFFENAPCFSPDSKNITGKICGDDVQGIRDPLIYRVRCLDKLVDELAKGKPLDKLQI